MYSGKHLFFFYLLTHDVTWNSLGSKFYKTNTNMLSDSTANGILVYWIRLLIRLISGIAELSG